MSVRLSALRDSSTEADGLGAAPSPRGEALISLEDRYDLLELVAEDPAGKTWSARQRDGGGEVALRLLSAGRELHDYEVRAERFLKLAALCVGLKHPNTARVLGFGKVRQSGAPALFLATERVDGRSLAEVLRAQGPLELRRALRVLIEVCRALEEAHAIGVVHGDLNPANVLLLRQDRGEAVRVAGFGIGDLFDELHHARDAASGPTNPAAYRAPESIRRLPLDGRADLYSLGALLHLMLTGQAVFARDNVMATLMAHLVEPVPSLRERAGREVPDTVEVLARRCLEKSARDRFPNVLALREALEIALGTLPVATRAPVERPPQFAEIDVLEGVRSIGGASAQVDLSGVAEPSVRPLEALSARAQVAATGCLTVLVSERASYRVFLMQGEIVALFGPGDALATLRRLVSVGAVAPARVSALGAELAGGVALDAVLNGEVPDAVIAEAMRAQVRQNAVSFAGLTGGALRWSDLDAVIVPDFAGFSEAVEALTGAVGALSVAAPARAPQVASPPPEAGDAAPASAPAADRAGAPPGGRSAMAWALVAVAALIALWWGLHARAPETAALAPATELPSAPAAPEAAAEDATLASAEPTGPDRAPAEAAPVKAPAPAAARSSAATPARASKPSKAAPPEAAAASPAASPAAAPASRQGAPRSDLKDPFAETR